MVIRGARWLVHRTGGRGLRILVEPPRNFGNSIYPTLPVSFGGDTKGRWSLREEVKDPTHVVNV